MVDFIVEFRDNVCDISVDCDIYSADVISTWPRKFVCFYFILITYL